MAVADRPAVRPPLKWAGGKRWQVPYLRPLWERHRRRRLVEPFCGGLAVALGLMPARALLNDVNPHLINFYVWLQRGLTPPIEMENREGRFYEHRARFNALLADWTFTTGDLASVPLERRDFVYADPPYDVEFRQYARGGFSWDDQERTAVWLARHRGPVVLVNQATVRVERLYRQLGFAVDFLEAPRRISCTGDRTPVREIVGTRNV